jgi:hypothetical protein
MEHPTPNARIAVAAEVEERVIRDFVATAPAPFLMLDHDLRQMEASPRWILEWGKDRSDLLGRHHYETLPDLPAHIKQAHSRALTGEVVSMAEDRFMMDGVEVRSSWSVRPWGLSGRKVGGLIIYAEDLNAKDRSALGSEPRQQAEPAPAHKTKTLGQTKALTWASDGRDAIQKLLAGYRDVSCSCDPEYYEEHRMHQLDCLAHPTVPLIVRGEQGARQLYLLEELIVKEWDLKK